MNNNKNNTIIWIKAISITLLTSILLILLIVLLRNAISATYIQSNTNSSSDPVVSLVNEQPVHILIPVPTSASAPSPEPAPTPTPEPPQPYVIAWISDTQGYCAYKPEIFNTMTKWIVDSADTMNIQYVLHTGDIVDQFDDMRQWENARNALSTLDDKVPLFTVAGNHDIHSGDHEYESYLKYFGEDTFDHLPTFGGAYRGGRGRYDLIEINGESIIMITIGYSVVSDDIDWINQVLQEHSEYTAILCFHGYMDPDETYTSDGRVLFPEVVAANKNVKLVLCGHRHGVNHNIVKFDDDGDGIQERSVYQILFNSQTSRDYGGGYMCLLSFDSVAGQIGVKSYSPYYDDSLGMEEFVVPWQ